MASAHCAENFESSATIQSVLLQMLLNSVKEMILIPFLSPSEKFEHAKTF